MECEFYTWSLPKVNYGLKSTGTEQEFRDLVERGKVAWERWGHIGISKIEQVDDRFTCKLQIILRDRKANPLELLETAPTEADIVEACK